MSAGHVANKLASSDQLLKMHASLHSTGIIRAVFFLALSTMPHSRRQRLAQALSMSDFVLVRELFGFMNQGVPPSVVELCLWSMLYKGLTDLDAT